MASLSTIIRKRGLFFLLFGIITVLFCGCHKSYTVKGVVIDELTDEPIPLANVRLKESDATLTDSLGSFEIEKVLTGGYAISDVEILVEKEGYKSQYINISKNNKNPGNLTVHLEQGTATNRFPQGWVKLFYIIKLVLSGINLITILFILFNRIPHKLLWISGIIFVNCVFHIIYIDGSVDFDFFHAPFFVLHYLYSPFTITVVLPIVTISFWMLYLKKNASTK